MTSERLRALTLEGFELMFNNGDLDYLEQAIAPGAVDHQEPEGTDFVAHLKEVIARRSPSPLGAAPKREHHPRSRNTPLAHPHR